MCGISTLPFEIPHKICYQDLEKYVVLRQVKFLLDGQRQLRSNMVHL